MSRKLIAVGFAAALVIFTLPRVIASMTTAHPGAAQPGAAQPGAAHPGAANTMAPGTNAPVVWEAASSSVANLAGVDPFLAAAGPGAAGSLTQNTADGGGRLAANPVRAGYRSQPAERWTSEARFAADLAAGAVPSYIRVAHYDNESWQATPLAEQRHPAWYEKAFCQLAHARGLLCATGPGRDLCPVAYPGPGRLNDCYLAHDMAGDAARYADYTDIQGQVNELAGTGAYAAFVHAAAAQAKAANPGNITLGNLSATPTGQPVSASQLCADARAVFGPGPGQVAGFYLTITDAGAATTAQFLRQFHP